MSGKPLGLKDDEDDDDELVIFAGTLEICILSDVCKFLKVVVVSPLNRSIINRTR